MKNINDVVRLTENAFMINGNIIIYDVFVNKNENKVRYDLEFDDTSIDSEYAKSVADEFVSYYFKEEEK